MAALNLRSQRGSFDDLDDAPGLALADRPALGDRDRVARSARAFLVVRHDLRGAANELSVGRVLDQALDRHGDALLHLVATTRPMVRRLVLSLASGLMCLLAT